MQTTAQELKSAIASIPTNLVDPLCAARLDLLTKRGALREGRAGIVIGILFTLFAALLGVGILQLNADDAGNAASDLEPLLGPMSSLLQPLLPVLPVLLFALSAVGLASTAHSIYRSLRVAKAPPMDVRCPGCGESHEISQANRKGFEFLCRRCRTLIRGDKLGYDHRHECAYCGHAFFGSPALRFRCPACQYSPKKSEGRCPACLKAIPKGVLFCRECLAWIGVKESIETSPLVETACYDVTLFGATACRALLEDLIARVEKFAKPFAEYWENVADVRSIQYYGAGGLVWQLDPQLHLVRKCLLTLQWLYCKGGAIPMERAVQLQQSLALIAPALRALLAAGTLLKSEQQEFVSIMNDGEATLKPIMER